MDEMTSTAVPVQPAAGRAPRPPVRRRRSSRRLLLGVVLTVLGALLAVAAYQLSVQRESVVAMARPVLFGQTVTRDDVQEIALPSDTGLSTVPWSTVDSVVGRVATTDLLAGQAITPDAVSQAIPPGRGEAVVGVAVGPGRAPTTPLAPRDEVVVVAVDDPRPPQRATVLRVGEPDASGKRTIDLLVAEGVAPDLARLSADDRAVIVHVGGR
jgi:hypothetical protein